MENKFRHVLLLILICSLQVANAQKKQKWYPGFTAGWQYSGFQYRNSETIINNNGAWRAAFVLDYEITRRLSFQTQIGVQRINASSILGLNNHTLTYPELWMGFTEYLPVGGGAAFINLSLNAGYGFSSGGTDVFQDKDYRPFKMGWGTTLGYLFRNGIFINTGFQSALTNYYDNNIGTKAFDFSIHALSIGYMAGNKQRNKARKGRY